MLPNGRRGRGRLGDVADRVTVHQLDLSDLGRIEAVVDTVHPTRFFRFGAMLTGPGERDPQTSLQANGVGFIHTIEAARRAGTEQFIFASSIGTYGRDLEPGPIDDRSLQRPRTAYGVKVLGENLGAYYRSKYGIRLSLHALPGHHRARGDHVEPCSVQELDDGPRPTPSAGESADAVRRHRTDDHYARDEWGWEPCYDVDDMIVDIIDTARSTEAT